jgi:hypothetical protein
MVCRTRSFRIALLLLVAGFVLAESFANAAPILFAPLTGATVQVQTFEPVGQSFIAEDPFVVAGLHFSVIDATFDPTEPIRYDLFLGQGVGGPLVTSTTFSLSLGTDDFFHMEDFSATTLTIGSTYSLVATVVGASPYWAITRSLEPAIGTGIGSVLPDYRYALSVNPVPEPSTAILVALGLIGMGIQRRRGFQPVFADS